MKAAPFDYVRPTTLDDVFGLMRGNPEGARIIAGGQSLLATLAFRLSEPQLLVDISRLTELKGISVGPSGVTRIGALTTHTELANSDIVRDRHPVLAEAARLIGHPAIRNRGTIGGSLAFADPAAELPACCVALDATIVVACSSGRRRIAAAQFFTRLFTTALGSDEVIEAVEFPAVAAGARAVIIEIARRSGDYAMAGIVACVEPGRSPGLVFFGVGDGPVRARLAGETLGSGPWSPSVIRDAQAALDRDLDPPGDQHGGPGLKRHLARVLLGRAMAHLSELASNHQE